eukprot:2809600-Amphidinium_carterae.1
MTTDSTSGSCYMLCKSLSGHSLCVRRKISAQSTKTSVPRPTIRKRQRKLARLIAFTCTAVQSLHLLTLERSSRTSPDLHEMRPPNAFPSPASPANHLCVCFPDIAV